MSIFSRKKKNASLGEILMVLRSILKDIRARIDDDDYVPSERDKRLLKLINTRCLEINHLANLMRNKE